MTKNAYFFVIRYNCDSLPPIEFVMNNEKAICLQEMGITRWVLRKPALFNRSQKTKEMNISHYALIVLDSSTDLENPLLNNILNAFKFLPDSVYYMSQAEFDDYHGELPEYVWSMLGAVSIPEGHKLLSSSSLAELEKNPQQKRALWKQFCAFNEL